MSDKPTFKIKKQTHPAHLNAIRVSNEVFQVIQKLCLENGVTQVDLIRQMIDFALEHMQKLERQGEG